MCAERPDQEQHPPATERERAAENHGFAERFMAEHPETFARLADLRERKADLYQRLADG